MLLEITCDHSLNLVFYYVKNILNLIMIIVPILLLVFGTVSFLKLVKNPEEKNGKKKIINQFLGAAIVFFVPLSVNVVMGMLGDGNDISRCWNEASKSEKASYIESNNGKSKKKFIPDAKDYEKGLGNLDFSCTSSTVKAQFSCDTLRIVENHLYDFDASNFHEKIASYGGFDAYAKSVGGIFGEYYGKKIEGRTTRDFQWAAEYVLGWMYMYGWDYDMPGGAHVKWGGRKYTKDAFYANGNFAVEHCDNESPGAQATGMGTNFDGVISTENQGGSVNKMASACGDLEVFIYNKLNINRKKQLPKVSRLRDLKIGDCMFFGEGGPKWDKYNEKTWYNSERAHNVVVGEVYDDHVVIYDGGMYYPTKQNYKREVYFPKEDTEAADDAAVKKVFGYSNWGIRRWYDFEVS